MGRQQQNVVKMESSRKLLGLPLSVRIFGCDCDLYVL